VAEQMINGGR